MTTLHKPPETTAVSTCPHFPPCPAATAVDHDAARTVADHHDQGWVKLCNGVIVFDDTGELTPEGMPVDPHRPGVPHSGAGWQRAS